MLTKKQTINWGKFSPKHKDYIKNGLNSVINIAEGSVRAGKTIDNCIIAFYYLENCKDKIHLASGYDVGNAKLNIGECNGYGLEYLFRGRCKWGRFKDNEALKIQTITGEKIVIFVGGGKANSYKDIQGNSYGLWFATELLNHHYSNGDKNCFITQAQNRQLASSSKKIIWDFNADNPNNPIYLTVDHLRDKKFCNYQHFNIYDNLNVSGENLEHAEIQYKHTITSWNRNILGLRTIAEGLIYHHFANNTDKYMIKKINPSEIKYISVGIDFGGNKSNHAIICSAICQKKIIILKSVLIKALGVTPDVLYKHILLFIDEIIKKYGKIDMIRVDSAEQTLKNGLQNLTKLPVRNSLKLPITDRINFTQIMMSSSNFEVLENECDNLVNAFKFAVWDNKQNIKDIRLDNGSSDIDSLDAFEYSIEQYINYF